MEFLSGIASFSLCYLDALNVCHVTLPKKFNKEFCNNEFMGLTIKGILLLQISFGVVGLGVGVSLLG